MAIGHCKHIRRNAYREGRLESAPLGSQYVETQIGSGGPLNTVARSVARIATYQYLGDEAGTSAMKTARTQRSVETPSRLIAAAFAIGMLYLTGLILIHQLAG